MIDIDTMRIFIARDVTIWAVDRAAHGDMIAASVSYHPNQIEAIKAAGDGDQYAAFVGAPPATVRTVRARDIDPWTMRPLVELNAERAMQ